MLFDTIDHAEQYREAFPAVYRVLQELKKYSVVISFQLLSFIFILFDLALILKVICMVFHTL